MSQALMSASERFLPRPGVSATAGTAATTKAKPTPIRMLRIHMFDRSAAVDAPARDAVVVLVRECQRAGQWTRRLSAHRHKFRASGLHIAGLVPGAALQDHRLPVPAPWHPEAGEGLWTDRPLQR